MSKVFHFFRFILPITLLTLMFLTIKAQPAFACQTKDGFVTCNDPENIYQDTPSVSFTITAPRDNAYDLGRITYRAIVWKGSSDVPTPDNTCLNLFNPFISPASGSTRKQLIFSWQVKGNSCAVQLGKWHFRAWAGGTGMDNTPTEALIGTPNYLFEIEQPGGGALKITAENSTLGPTDTPQVNLFNARKDNWYEFWWDGSVTELAAQMQAPNDGNILKIDLVKNGVDWSQLGKKRLCVDVTPTKLSEPTYCRPGLDAIFDLKAVSPPITPSPSPGTSGSCIIQVLAAHLPKPAKSDTVSANVSNLSPGQIYRTEFISENQPPKTQTLTANQNGMIPLELKDHIDVGTYTVNIYDTTNNDPICTNTFTVTEKGSDITPNDKCPENGCTKVGEDSGCDVNGGRGPAIKTAIGCVHTSPTEFVKDVMTFVIGISGGLAFLLMILGAFQMLTSAGNPDTLRAGRERLTSAIIGLLIVIFATLLLQIIGLDILQIPGFKR